MAFDQAGYNAFGDAASAARPVPMGNLIRRFAPFGTDVPLPGGVRLETSFEVSRKLLEQPGFMEQAFADPKQQPAKEPGLANAPENPSLAVDMRQKIATNLDVAVSKGPPASKPEFPTPKFGGDIN